MKQVVRLGRPLRTVTVGARAAAGTSAEEAAWLRGLEEGEAAAVEQCRALLAGVAAETRALRERQAAEERELVSFAVDLALSLAGLVVAREVGAGSYDLPALATAAIRRARETGQAPLRVRVHPEDFEKLVGRLRDAVDLAEGAEGLPAVSDATVPRGGVRVETATGRVETDPALRLQILREAVSGP